MSLSTADPTTAATGADASPGHGEGGSLRPRGSNQGGMRQYNERVVLHAIRLHGPSAKADLARLTGLSTQTVSLIINRLLDDGLVRKLERVRGRIGQPSVPMALDADGAYAIGVEIGRRGTEVLLVDFTGAVRQRRSFSYRVPEPDSLLAQVKVLLDQLAEGLGPRRERIVGLGVAAPLFLGGWHTLLGWPEEVSRRWSELDLRASLAERSGLPTTFVKDTAAACAAELVSGHGRTLKNFLYLYVDTFIGGGLVLNSHLHGGWGGNAGAVGSLPLSRAAWGQSAPPQQLLGAASLFNLEQRFLAAGLEVSALLDERALQAPWRAHTLNWMKETATGIAMAVVSATCLMDLEGVIIDSTLAPTVLRALLDEVRSALPLYSHEGIGQTTVWPGSVGPDARALGGALLPLYGQFAPDHEVFLNVER